MSSQVTAAAEFRQLDIELARKSHSMCRRYEQQSSQKVILLKVYFFCLHYEHDTCPSVHLSVMLGGFWWHCAIKSGNGHDRRGQCHGNLPAVHAEADLNHSIRQLQSVLVTFIRILSGGKVCYVQLTCQFCIKYIQIQSCIKANSKCSP